MSDEEVTSKPAADNVSSKCVFCDICAGRCDKEKILYEDTDIVVFPDIRPVTTHHYLVTSKQHIRDAKHLTGDNVTLVEKMVHVGKQVLEEKGGNVDDIRMGFHWPPFHSVNHLHLHVISPLKEMGLVARTMFKLNSFWFVSPVWVLARLKNSLPK
ncbi:histidine triad nucleotide-binding protein 3-like [Argonauta hians]